MRGARARPRGRDPPVLFWATVAALLVTRRFRHLFVFLGAVVGVIALSSLLAYPPCDPARWAWRSWGIGPAPRIRPARSRCSPPPWSACSTAWCPRPTAPARQAGHRRPGHRPGRLPGLPGCQLPTDVLIGAIIGVTIPPGRLPSITPSEVFRSPTTGQLGPPGRGRPPRPGHPPRPRGPAGHPGRGGQAVRPVRPGRLHPAAGQAQGDPNTYLFAKLYARSHLRADRWYKLGRTCCTAGWRTRSRSTPSGGWSSRRTTPCGCSTGPGSAAPSRSGSSRSPPSAST